MIKSMTGFASLTHEVESATIGVTVRSVNHKYLDLQLRLAAGLLGHEPRVRAILQRRLSRGRVEVSVAVQPRRAPEIEVDLNESFVAAVSAALERARAHGLVEGSLSAGDLLRFPQALTIRERLASDEEGADPTVLAAVEETLERAIDQLEAMRVREGEHLHADLDARRSVFAALVERIAVEADEGRAAFELRLARRVGELALEVPVDSTVIAQEVVRIAARADISEELVRLRAHLVHWVELAGSPEPCGRKLDFLLQEMNREVNTMGAKAEGARIAELVVAAKAELEKMREQAQNVE
jgi:uncharacterized protein (TIGR00255 family)